MYGSFSCPHAQTCKVQEKPDNKSREMLGMFAKFKILAEGNLTICLWELTVDIFSTHVTLACDEATERRMWAGV